MDNLTLLSGIIGFALVISWVVGLWNLSRSRKENSESWFFVLLYLPFLIGLVFTANLHLLGESLLMVFISIALTIIYFGLWGYTLYEVGGENKLVWFILILMINPLWVLYRLVNVR